jgi:hypothetical protein
VTDTPETDNLARGNHVVPTEFAEHLERERDEARDALSEISLYLSVGMGDKSTTAKQYYERILEGVGMLTQPIMSSLEKAKETISTMEIRHAAVMLHTQGVVDELNQCKEQQDRLLIVIEAATILIAAKGRHNTMLAYNGLRDALQSTTLNKP